MEARLGYGELEVSAICQFDMSNEVIGSVSIDYLRPSSVEGHSDDCIRIVGTDGIIETHDNKMCVFNGKTVEKEKIPLATSTLSTLPSIEKTGDASS